MKDIYNQKLIKQDLVNSYNSLNLLIKDQTFIKSLNDLINYSGNRIKEDSKIIFCGNGGSAAESQHFAAELTSKYRFNRKAINSVALTTDTSAITSIGNDFGYEYIFSRQIDAIGNEGDILIGISTSGKSPNIIKAFESASKKNIKSYLWTGDHNLENLPNIKNLKIMKFPSKQTSYIQEMQLIAGHIYCGALEEFIMGDDDV